jgi:hypothetical protein
MLRLRLAELTAGGNYFVLKLYYLFWKSLISLNSCVLSLKHEEEAGEDN